MTLTADQQKLQTRIANDPNGRGYAPYVSAGNRSQVLALANEPVIAARKPVAIATLQEWLMKQGLWITWRNSADPSAQMAMDLVNSRLDNVDLDDPVTQQMMSAAVAASPQLMTQTQADAMSALADTQIGDAEDAMGRPATIDDIRAVV